MATSMKQVRAGGQARQATLVGLLEQRGAALQARRSALREPQAPDVTDVEERSVAGEELGVGLSLLEIASREVKGIEEALVRWQAGEAGTCADCGARIPKQRLRAVPFARQCVRCRERQDLVEEAARRKDAGAWLDRGGASDAR
jgi:DnaK suppressor protein